MSRYILALLLVSVVAVVVHADYDSDSDSKSSEENSPKCPQNEVWNGCGKMCESSCTTTPSTYCPSLKCTNALAGCTCKPNYVRKENRCVKFDEC